MVLCFRNNWKLKSFPFYYGSRLCKLLSNAEWGTFGHSKLLRCIQITCKRKNIRFVDFKSNRWNNEKIKTKFQCYREHQRTCSKLIYMSGDTKTDLFIPALWSTELIACIRTGQKSIHGAWIKKYVIICVHNTTNDFYHYFI